MARQLRVLAALAEDMGGVLVHTHSSQPSATPGPDLTPSSGLFGHCTCVVHIHASKTPRHKSVSYLILDFPLVCVTHGVMFCDVTCHVCCFVFSCLTLLSIILYGPLGIISLQQLSGSGIFRLRLLRILSHPI